MHMAAAEPAATLASYQVIDGSACRWPVAVAAFAIYPRKSRLAAHEWIWLLLA
jgi:hypothetical protein